jgi:Na+/melibiose symporter-like transporter
VTTGGRVRLTAGTRAGYATGSLVTGAFGTVPGLLLLPYLTGTLAVPAALAGLLVLLPKAWDVLLNPVAGRISDRAGARRPFLLAGGLVLAAAFALLFAGPTTSPAGPVWVVVAFLACASAFAFFQVPYVAMPAELTDDYDERTRLMAPRIAVLAIAILVSGAGAPLVRDLAGYPAMGAAVGALIAVGTVVTVLGLRGVAAPVRASATTWGELAAAVRGNRAFRTLLVVFVVQAVGIGCLLAGVDYVARLTLGDAGSSSVLFAAFVGPAVLVTPLWARVGARVGKRAGFRAASVLLGAAAAALLLAGRVPFPVVAVLAALAGAGYAGVQVFPLAMLPDVTAGSGQVGGYAGIWTAAETLGLALGPGLYGLVLASGGFVSGPAAVQPPGAALAVVVGFSVVPAALVLAGAVLLRKDVLR